ncbi:MAG: HD-GYP domain-containing protein, partial [Actinomycetota bacterium]|nr:HD-GYP domain-containing protein [Actinomycetota bacterium]
MSLAAARLFGAVVARPQAWTPRIVWLTLIITISWLAFRAAHRGFRRLTPLASLLNMRLVFPDQAPSRFRAALRSQSARELERRLDDPDAAADLPLPGDHARELVGLIGELSEHDRLTRGHSERVRAYSDVIAAQMELPSEDRNKLHWGALLHDVGKLFVDPEVLNATGRPDEAGWQQIRQHPARADSLLRGLSEWLGPWTGAATEHHERYDGEGYPNGLAGKQISLAGRIVAVADAFDVMTSTRSYKKALSHEAARQELARNVGTQFDPAVVRAFLEAGLNKQRALPGFLGALGELA